MNYTDIAKALGITKGRVSQIRATAPPAERAFFGVGPVAVGVPYRYQTTDRERPLVAAEDAQAGELATALLTSLGFATSSLQFGPETTELPPGDLLVICGPKSAPAARDLLAEDAALSFIDYDGRWYIQDHTTGTRHASSTDGPERSSVDLAYLGRHVRHGRVVVHVAGIHAIGSLGALHYLANQLPNLYSRAPTDSSLSLAVAVRYRGLTAESVELLCGPHVS
ncbi:hypothetical protein [uncultured Cellulomonas sp.]|uniref:hypothetical protein n=1 Tax=uncultured Cellulomonas sp. TaxID=189682 RepID=UPI002628664D|nr:hypothetical protein [uncultured Cellulomonas sp.]